MPPIRCSQGLGATRKAAMSVPTAIAITNETTTSCTVIPKPRRNSSKFSVSVSTKAKGTLSCVPLAGGVLLDELHGLVDRDVGGLGLGVRVLADPLLVGIRVAAVLLVLGEHAVDELLELRVALLDAGAVGLLAELVPDELQRVVLDDHARQDHVVGRDRVDAAVLQRLEALRVGVDELELGVGRLLLERRLVGRAERGADVLAGERVDAGDVGVVLLDEDPALGDVVGVGEL